ncbi:hypothetical protein J43TS3_00280 [Ornithinibacillus bavariensis]|uniref:Uncharacterized protein n=1 Tax=Ornithinibacillus bavariensis TaxID=545502 RepID=A0A919X6L0_9BACI|nr:hypothetical protein J43TS3_00280 [Ornithinibacillus bavariensis]
MNKISQAPTLIVISVVQITVKNTSNNKETKETAFDILDFVLCKFFGNSKPRMKNITKKMRAPAISLTAR